MHTQPTPPGRGRSRSPYPSLLAERLRLGRLYADHLSHLQTATPQALLLFTRLLSFDAALARCGRYDHDLMPVVTPAEDRRIHFPPDSPVDHDTVPCALCLGQALGLTAVTVLLPATRQAA